MFLCVCVLFAFYAKIVFWYTKCLVFERSLIVTPNSDMIFKMSVAVA